MERHYRDSRIQRIFEGTNEINRILIPTMLFRKADSGSLNLWGKVEEAQMEITEGDEAALSAGPFGAEKDLVASLKKLLLVMLGSIGREKDAQEIMLAVADMIITVFALESSLLRADMVFVAASDKKKELLQAVVKVAGFELTSNFQQAAFRCNAYINKGVHLGSLQKVISLYSNYAAEGLLEAKQVLADAAKDSGKYIF